MNPTERRPAPDGDATEHSPTAESSDASRFPTADVRQSRTWTSSASGDKGTSRWWQTRVWWLAIASGIAAVVISGVAWKAQPLEIRVRFPEGHGIQPGDELRYRGIAIGEVSQVRLAENGQQVELRIALAAEATAVAREGSEFWIQRPQLSLSRMSGLDTLVGARYVSVRLGAESGKRATTFEGKTSPPRLSQPTSTTIEVTFPEGHGLTVGDPLQYRGVDVGEVTNIELEPNLHAVHVTIQLVTAAEPLSRRGSKFWIERPELSFRGLRGLGTVVGGRHIAVAPGKPTEPAARQFEGLADAPIVFDDTSDNLELVLVSLERSGVNPGAPINYRGVEIGRITRLALSTDAREVHAGVVIDARYKELVRENSVFWSVSGVGLGVGISGVKIDVESLSALAVGGVALATPDQPGAPVASGKVFPLHAEPEKRWLRWQPTIPLPE